LCFDHKIDERKREDIDAFSLNTFDVLYYKRHSLDNFLPPVTSMKELVFGRQRVTSIGKREKGSDLELEAPLL
jgi:hypothetical protein